MLFKPLNVLDLQCVSCKITLLFSIKDAIKLSLVSFVVEAHTKYIVIKEKPPSLYTPQISEVKT